MKKDTSITIPYRVVYVQPIDLIFLYTLSLIMLAVLSAWGYLIVYCAKSLKYSPKLVENREIKSDLLPQVSIIVPALNEEKYIARCLQSLLAQDYHWLEIISVDDGSTDNTLMIMKSVESADQRIHVVEAGQRPDGWVGKNWACFVGYNNSKGDILIFTDADTVHSEETVTLAVSRLLQENLSAITAIPKLISEDFLTSVTLPLLSVFLQTRFSPLKVNDPANKLGYFFGSFFAIERGYYESIGTHEEVRDEIIEDGAIGSLVKKSGMKMKMYRGEDSVNALWARDRRGLWNGLLRLLVPMHREQGKKSIPMVIAIAFLMLFPILAFPIGIYLEYRPESSVMGLFLAAAALLALCTMIITTVLILSQSMKTSKKWAPGSLIGAIIITMSFVVSLLSVHQSQSFAWKGRTYI